MIEMYYYNGVDWVTALLQKYDGNKWTAVDQVTYYESTGPVTIGSIPQALMVDGNWQMTSGNLSDYGWTGDAQDFICANGLTIPDDKKWYGISAQYSSSITPSSFEVEVISSGWDGQIVLTFGDIGLYLFPSNAQIRFAGSWAGMASFDCANSSAKYTVNIGSNIELKINDQSVLVVSNIGVISSALSLIMTPGSDTSKMKIKSIKYS